MPSLEMAAIDAASAAVASRVVVVPVVLTE